METPIDFNRLANPLDWLRTVLSWGLEMSLFPEFLSTDNEYSPMLNHNYEWLCSLYGETMVNKSRFS